MSTKQTKEQPFARCCDCERCTRDTSGPSFSIITKEYFMGTCPKGHADGRVFIDKATGDERGRVFMDKARVCTDFYKKVSIMSTIKYSNYVVVNEKAGIIVWHGSRDNAVQEQKDNGGKLYDFTKDNPVIIERALQAARKKMGVE